MTKKVSNENYLGNTLLKRIGVQTEWTPELLSQYGKCAADPIYFTQNYVKIISLDDGLIPFLTRPYQDNMIKQMADNRFVICKCPRQSGKTTTVASLLLWYALFNETFNILILANKEEQAIEILDRVKLAYEHLPKWLQQGVVEWNKKSIVLENGAIIRAAATSSSASRGKSVNILYLDEFAHVPNNIAEDFFTSVYPVITSGTTTKVIITSTPKGMNLFYKIWSESLRGQNSYTRVEVDWSEIPGRDEKWKKETIANTSERQFEQEFACAFLGSSSTLIDGKCLRVLSHINPISESENFKVYRDPIPNHIYCVMVDSARGTNKDYSAFTVIDVSSLPYQVVAVYRNNLISTLVFPTPVISVAKKYNDATVLIETNDLGMQVADVCYKDLEYENVVWTVPGGRAGLRISGGHAKDSKLGIRTSKTTKAVGCNNIKAIIENSQIILNDFNIINELSKFSLTTTGSYAAEEGNDDLAMCLVLFGWYSSQPEFKDLTNLDIRQALQDDTTAQIEEDLVPFGIILSGHEYFDETAPVVELAENQTFEDWMSNNGDW